jgi:hypothetical protein
LSRVIGEHNVQQSWYRLHNEEGGVAINLTLPIVDTNPRSSLRLQRRLRTLRQALYFRGNILVAMIQAISGGNPWPPCACIASKRNGLWEGSRKGVTLKMKLIRTLTENVAADMKRTS